eukprot:1158250-Pelagomonas_calceolata.AAC.2
MLLRVEALIYTATNPTASAGRTAMVSSWTSIARCCLIAGNRLFCCPILAAVNLHHISLWPEEHDVHPEHGFDGALVLALFVKAGVGELHEVVLCV